jgi:hypothetical protein
MDYVEKCWDLANIITGFSIAQGVGFLLLLRKVSFATQVKNAYWLIIPLIVGFGIAYIYGIIKMGELERSALNTCNDHYYKISHTAMLLRIYGVVLNHLLLILIVLCIRFL